MHYSDLTLVLFIAAAGIIGTGLGGVIGSLMYTKKGKGSNLPLAFSLGIMFGLVIFSIFPESIELSGIGPTAIIMVIGIFSAGIINLAIVKSRSGSGDIHGDLSLQNSGIMFVVAVSLHNLPEGIALGAGAHHNIALGITWAILITLHNLPMGMSISIPLIESGKSKWFSIILTALVGSTLLIGGVVGILLGDIGEAFLAGALSLAGGILLFVVIKEKIQMFKSKALDAKTILIIILGIALSFVITSLGGH